MGKLISQLVALIGNLAGTELLEIETADGESKYITVNKLSQHANTYIRSLRGDIEIATNSLTLTVGDDTDGYTTAYHSSLVGKGVIKLLMQNSDKINRADISFNSSTGTITLANGAKFRKDCTLYLQYAEL